MEGPGLVGLEELPNDCGMEGPGLVGVEELPNDSGVEGPGLLCGGDDLGRGQQESIHT